MLHWRRVGSPSQIVRSDRRDGVAARPCAAWPVAFSLVLVRHHRLLLAMRMLVSPMGRLGGMFLGLIIAACFSSYLHLVSFAVAGSKITLADLRHGFVRAILGCHQCPVCVLGDQLCGRDGDRAGRRGDKADIVMVLLFGLAMARLLFNPVPELLYQGSSRSFYLLMESGTFISKHGLEWFLPNILAAVALLAPLGLLHGPAGYRSCW